MVWGSFGWNNKSNFVFIDGKINSTGYTKISEDNLITRALHLANDNYIFQHVSNATKQKFKNEKHNLIGIAYVIT